MADQVAPKRQTFWLTRHRHPDGDGIASWFQCPIAFIDGEWHGREQQTWSSVELAKAAFGTIPDDYRMIVRHG